MKQLTQFLAEKNEITIYTLASYIRQYIREQFPLIMQENQAMLEATFAKAGEYAYSVYGRTLFRALNEQLKQSGLRFEPDFPGHLNTSIEYWGPPEERERCMWSVVSTEQGEVLGTLVTRIFHDHTRFRVPHAPGIIVLQETETEAIIAALAHTSVRMSGAPQEEERHGRAALWSGGWEYSVEIGLGDCIDNGRIEISESMLEQALALWGQHNWELVTAVPHQGRLLAFFKRPIG